MKSIISNTTVKVEDLGITLYPGQAVWVEDGDFNSSQCLRALRSMGKVEVMSKDRHKTLRSPSTSRTNRAAKKFKKGPVSPQVVPEAKPQTQKPVEPVVSKREAEIAASKAVKKAAEEAAKMAISAMMPLIQEIKETVSTQGSIEGIDLKIENAVSRAIGGMTPVSGSGSSIPRRSLNRVPSSEEPVFIPKGIVKEDSQVLSVNSSSSEDEELDSTMAALKALKKK